jgi:holo-[acyl-carrier protein] synthase
MSVISATESASARSDHVRVGVDLVSVDDVRESMARYGDRYTRRLFSEHELAETAGSAQTGGLAARFAAKEAAMKVLEPDLEVPGWRSIEVRRQPSGRPALVLHGTAGHLAAAAGLDRWALSMSHEGSVAVAVVVAAGPRLLAADKSGPPGRRRRRGTPTTEAPGAGSPRRQKKGSTHG